MSMHIYPHSEEDLHSVESLSDCQCEPEVLWLDPETDLPWTGNGPMVIHNGILKTTEEYDLCPEESWNVEEVDAS